MEGDVGMLIRETRQRHGLTQAQLAYRASTTQAVVSKIERGTVSPTLRTVLRLLAAMGWELDLGVRRSRWRDSNEAALRAHHALTPQQRFDAFLSSAGTFSALHESDGEPHSPGRPAAPADGPPGRGRG